MSQPKLGFIGIGLMGKPMTLRLLAAGYKVAVWNRSRDKLAPVTAKGAIAKDSPADVARFADIVMMCVTDQHSVREVLFGAGGIAEGASEGKIVIDFYSHDDVRAFMKRLHNEIETGVVAAPLGETIAEALQPAQEGDLAEGGEDVMEKDPDEDLYNVKNSAHIIIFFVYIGKSIWC